MKTASSNLQIQLEDKIALAAKPKGYWELDLAANMLYWSPSQYRIYGYEPQELCLDDKYFIMNTTHISDLKRITRIVDKALADEEAYNFRRRIVKKRWSPWFCRNACKDYQK